MYRVENENNLLTLEEFAEHMGISKSKAYDMLTAKEVRGIKVGRIWRIPVSSINEYIRNRLTRS